MNPGAYLYLAWRVADTRMPQGTGYGGSPSYARSECSVCGERVWVQPQNVEGRVVVCWPCENDKP